MKRRLAFFLLIALIGLLGACQTTTSTTLSTQTTTTSTQSSISTTNAQVSAIAGTYYIDITDLGMPLQFYLKILPNGQFHLSNKVDLSEDKGHGTITFAENQFTMKYDGQDKQSTFITIGQNLQFTSNLAYGASNITYQVLDEETSEVLHTLKALTLKHQEVFGMYEGSHQTNAMGQTIHYFYTITLEVVSRYVFLSSFEVGGEYTEYHEQGEFQIDGSVIRLKPDTEVTFFDGSIGSENSLTLPIKPSNMANRELRVFQEYIAPVFELSGEYQLTDPNSSTQYPLFLTLNSDRSFVVSNAFLQEDVILSGEIVQRENRYTMNYQIDNHSYSCRFIALGNTLVFEEDFVLPHLTLSLPTNPDVENKIQAQLLSHLDFIGIYEYLETVESLEVHYTLELKLGNRYRLHGKAGTFEVQDQGQFAISNQTITFITDNPAISSFRTGTILSNKDIRMELLYNDSSPGVPTTLVHQHQLTTSGLYKAFKTQTAGKTTMYETTASLQLESDGTYAYRGLDTVNGEVTENGTYTIQGQLIQFTPNGSSSSYPGWMKDGTIQAGFKVSTMSTSRTELMFVHSIIMENYLGEITHNGKLIEVRITMKNNFTCVLEVKQDGTLLWTSEGIIHVTPIQTIWVTFKLTDRSWTFEWNDDLLGFYQSDNVTTPITLQKDNK